MPRAAKTLREIDILSPEEVHTLIHLVSRRSPTGVRNRALLAVLYGAGLRIAEALALRPKDVDLDRLTVRVHRGKGSKARTAALNPGAAPYVERWLDKRRQYGLRGTQPLFCTITSGRAGSARTRPGRPLSDAYVRGWLTRLAEKARTVAGIEKRIHAHGFRHSHADQLRRRGWDMEQIRRQLGHSSLAVTGQYLDHIGANELSDKMRGEDWGL